MEFAEGVPLEADGGSSRATYGATDRMLGFGRIIFRHQADESLGMISTRAKNAIIARDEETSHREA